MAASVYEPADLKMRRSDRAMEDEAWIRSFLRRAPVGVLATVHDGRPLHNANLFLYDEPSHAIYVHTARTGRTREVVEAVVPACFSAFEMGRLLPAAEALEFSVEYASVTAFGTAEVVADPEESRRVLQLMLDKYFAHLKPGVDYRPITDDELKRTSVYRLAVEAWTGKRKQVEPGFPGAFTYAMEEGTWAKG